MREEDLPAEQPETQQEARFSDSNAQPWGPSSDPASASQGSQSPVGLIWRVRDRASFRALAESRRHRRGVLTMTRVASTPGDPPRVAFAIGRSAGNAVTRNRLRRRLRALCRQHHTDFARGHAYLIGARPGANIASYRDLDDALSELIARSARSS
jgi:ribonuclease P protein component